MKSTRLFIATSWSCCAAITSCAPSEDDSRPPPDGLDVDAGVEGDAATVAQDAGTIDGSPGDEGLPPFAGVKAASVISANAISLQWTALTDDPTPSASIVYEVCQSTTAGGCAANFVVAQTTAAGVTSTTVSGLSEGTVYYFSVRARNAASPDLNTVEVSIATCVKEDSVCAGACTSLAMDPANCGSCGHACGAGDTCSAGQCLTVPKPIALAAGTDHTCALLSNGRVACWGYNRGHQLNDVSATPRLFSPSPSGVYGLTGIAAISASGWHTCALRADGTVACWGGSGDSAYTRTDRTLKSYSGFGGGGATAVATDPLSPDCALLKDGTVACWGYSPRSDWPGLEPWDGGWADMPVVLPGLSVVTAISAPCGLTAGGTVVCWTDEVGGQRTISGINGASAISGPCALLTDRTVICWDPNASSPMVAVVPGVHDVTAISSTSESGSCALLADGTVVCWERYFSDATPFPATPVLVAGLSGVAALAVGASHACALLTGGEIKCWGTNEFGQLGDGTTTDSITPVTVLEMGFICDPTQQCRRAECGDGIVDSYTDRYSLLHDETCDDGNARSGDGCASDCLLEPGWRCDGAGQLCRVPHCGDSLIESYTDGAGAPHTESCDDGNPNAGDGCSADCTLETDWRCDMAGKPCRIPRCGDGLIESYPYQDGGSQTESCDDGNPNAGDGCSANCTLEPGWKCDSAAKPCRIPRCGDGLVESYADVNGLSRAEVCDRGDTLPGDGCAADCTAIEPGWVCKKLSCASTCTYDANQCFLPSNRCSALLNDHAAHAVAWQSEFSRRLGTQPDCPYVQRTTSGAAAVSFVGDVASGWTVNVSNTTDAVIAQSMTALNYETGSRFTASTKISRCINHTFLGLSGFGDLTLDVDCEAGSITLSASCGQGGGTVCAARYDTDESWRLNGSAIVP